jgi:hypothetical protein
MEGHTFSDDEGRRWLRVDCHTVLLRELDAEGVEYRWREHDWQLNALTIETVEGPLRLWYDCPTWRVHDEDVTTALEHHVVVPPWKRHRGSFYASLPDALGPQPGLLKLLWATAPCLLRRARVLVWACVQRRYGRDVATCVVRGLQKKL